MNPKLKIVVIEDEESIRNLYVLKLSLEGYDVKEAKNGAEGLEVIENFDPNLILLDLKMPEMNGDEMLEKMRATNWGSKPRVIVLTNISRDEAPHNLRFLNVEKYIVKAHHTPSQVVEIIEKTLAY